MEPMYYIGPGVHKQKVSCRVNEVGGALNAEGSLPATRFDLDSCLKNRSRLLTAAMEATKFNGWNLRWPFRHGAAPVPLVVQGQGNLIN